MILIMPVLISWKQSTRFTAVAGNTPLPARLVARKALKNPNINPGKGTVPKVLTRASRAADPAVAAADNALVEQMRTGYHHRGDINPPFPKIINGFNASTSYVIPKSTLTIFLSMAPQF
jgi:hypothetical protein